MNMVNPDIFGEIDFFAASFLAGMILVLAYDVLRILRQLMPHGTLWLAMEDLFYWLGCAFVVFALLYEKNDGLIRGFAIGGVVAGMLTYQWLVSRVFVRCIVIVLKRILYIVEQPFRWVHQVFENKRRAMQVETKKIIKNLKKGLKNLLKEFKMGLYK